MRSEREQVIENVMSGYFERCRVDAAGVPDLPVQCLENKVPRGPTASRLATGTALDVLTFPRAPWLLGVLGDGGLGGACS